MGYNQIKNDWAMGRQSSPWWQQQCAWQARGRREGSLCGAYLNRTSVTNRPDKYNYIAESTDLFVDYKIYWERCLFIVIAIQFNGSQNSAMFHRERFQKKERARWSTCSVGEWSLSAVGCRQCNRHRRGVCKQLERITLLYREPSCCGHINTSFRIPFDLRGLPLRTCRQNALVSPVDCSVVIRMSKFEKYVSLDVNTNTPTPHTFTVPIQETPLWKIKAVAQ